MEGLRAHLADVLEKIDNNTIDTPTLQGLTLLLLAHTAPQAAEDADPIMCLAYGYFLQGLLKPESDLKALQL